MNETHYDVPTTLAMNIYNSSVANDFSSSCRWTQIGLHKHPFPEWNFVFCICQYSQYGKQWCVWCTAANIVHTSRKKDVAYVKSFCMKKDKWSFFPDFSAEAHCQRKAYDAVKQRLQAGEIHYALQFPAKLRITHDAKNITFQTRFSRIKTKRDPPGVFNRWVISKKGDHNLRVCGYWSCCVFQQELGTFLENRISETVFCLSPCEDNTLWMVKKMWPGWKKDKSSNSVYVQSW